MALLDITLRAIRHNKLIPAGSTVVVGVSGGPDSLALLHVLHQLSAKLDYVLHVATFDHQLRGESSAADVAFVEQVCMEWGVPVSTGRADVRLTADAQGVSIEVAARQARYDFLARVAHEAGARVVAVAHHADDQAETVLMHILRGAGLDGLGGMGLQSAMPGHPDLVLIRPFLDVTRAQIEAYCTEHRLAPREDVSNQDISFLRNYLRWEALPNLEKLNPNIRRALVQLADVARVERDYMERQLGQVIEQHASTQPGGILIAREVFRGLHPALQRRFVYWASQRLTRGSTTTGYRHVVAAVEIGLRGKVGATALLAGAVRLRVDYTALVIEQMDAAPHFADIPMMEEGTGIKVAIPGSTLLPGGRWRLNASTIPGDRIKAQAHLSIPAGRDVVLRTRREGDRFAPLGMNGHTQKVGRWMINRKIPKAVRERIPLLVIDGQIAAIAFGEAWTISHWFAVNEAASPSAYFAWVKNEP
jgi:tRNA(Ile)-lysidine synthase